LAPSLNQDAAEVRKIDAAQRQLDEVIRLWMEGRDPLAMHTLTMAAFGVLYDVARHQKLLRDDDPLLLLLSRMELRELRKLASFLKHADRDPLAGYIEPPIQEHEWRIGFTLVLYRLIVSDLTPEMGAFHLTMLSTYPELFRIAPDPDPQIEEAALYTAELQRKSWDKRRLTTKVYLECMKSGTLPANVSLKRRER
jgi:hypothetical protein